jgi:hypothetical protein
MSEKSLQPGTKVVATYGRRNPETGKEWTGVVLDRADPKAWIGSLAFPGAEPADPEKVKAHVEKHRETLQNRVPVAWDFGKTYWERIERLKPVREVRWLSYMEVHGTEDRPLEPKNCPFSIRCLATGEKESDREFAVFYHNRYRKGFATLFDARMYIEKELFK